MIKIPGIRKLNTITDLYSGDPNFLKTASGAMTVLSAKTFEAFNIKVVPSEGKLLPLETSSPSHKVS